ncbi:MAG TPA: class I SAM-dependent methyltransferase [Candidatus Polarisedimenticolia bacterium]|nr:class I SAM-dependent methyltransferase [Candidatus Polarisedimenticolia bacterium]
MQRPGDFRRYALSQRWDSGHLRTVRRLLDPQPGTRILEVGSGRGHLTKRLDELGAIATGIDLNAEAVANAVARDIRQMSVEALDFADGEFDQLVAVHAIEHFPDLPLAMRQMARVLRPGGRALFVYPAEPIRGLFAVPDAIIIYRNPFKARQLHRQKLRPRKVRALAAAAGLDHVHSEFQLLSSPQFATVVRKPWALRQREPLPAWKAPTLHVDRALGAALDLNDPPLVPSLVRDQQEPAVRRPQRSRAI